MAKEKKEQKSKSAFDELDARIQREQERYLNMLLPA